jgi:hypothetical protein
MGTRMSTRSDMLNVSSNKAACKLCGCNTWHLRSVMHVLPDPMAAMLFWVLAIGPDETPQGNITHSREICLLYVSDGLIYRLAHGLRGDKWIQFFITNPIIITFVTSHSEFQVQRLERTRHQTFRDHIQYTNSTVAEVNYTFPWPLSSSGGSCAIQKLAKTNLWTVSYKMMYVCSFEILDYHSVNCKDYCLLSVTPYWLIFIDIEELFNPEYGDKTFLRNVGKYLPEYIILHSRRQ